MNWQKLLETSDIYIFDKDAEINRDDLKKKYFIPLDDVDEGSGPVQYLSLGDSYYPESLELVRLSDYKNIIIHKCLTAEGGDLAPFKKIKSRGEPC